MFVPGARDLTIFWNGPLNLRPVAAAADAPPAANDKTRYNAEMRKAVRAHLQAQSTEDEVHFSSDRLDTEFAFDAAQNEKAGAIPAAIAKTPAAAGG